MRVLNQNKKVNNSSISAAGIRRLLLLTVAVLIHAAAAMSVSAQAQDVYITPDGGGSGVCTNNTHPPSWFNNSGNWGTGGSQIGPGTIVHLCGTFTDSTPGDTLLSFQASGTNSSPITLLFEAGATLTNTNYWSGNNGAINSSGHNNITIDGGSNGLVQNTGNGSGRANQKDTKGVVIVGCSANCRVKNLTVANLYVHIPGTSSSNQGEDGPNPNGVATGIACDTCSNSTLGPNNTAHDNFVGIEHSWLSGNDSNMTVTGNTVYRNNWGILVSGQNGGITNEVISDNDVSDAFTWDDWQDGNHHNGIFVFETGAGSTISNLQQYGNYVHGNMGAICDSNNNSHATAFIFNDYNGGRWISPLLFNNVLVNTNPNCGPANGMLTIISNSGTGGIYNNTFTGRGAAINVTGTFAIKNNVFSKTDLGITSLNGTIGASDYNLYYALTGANQPPSAVMIDHNSPIKYYSTISQWIANSGFDKNASVGNPNLTANFQLGAGTAAGGGVNLTSLGIAALNVDRAGNPRPGSGPWDRGAYLSSSSAGNQAPAPPTGLTAIVQ